MLDSLRRLLRGRRPVADGESDVAPDPHLARSRATGGRPSDAGDRAVTTGTGDNEEFVGRVAGQDEGFAGETGAEARSSEAPRSD